MRPRWNFALGAGSLVVGVILVVLVLKLVPGSLDIVVTSILNVHPFWGFLVLVFTVVNIWLTVVKWGLVFRNIGRATERHQTGLFMLYVAVGALLAHLMPRFIGVFGARSVALKYHRATSWGKGLLSILYDLLFDFFAPLIALPFSLLAIFQVISVPLALVLMIVSIGLAALSIRLWHRGAVSRMMAVYGLLRRSVRRNTGDAEEIRTDTPNLFAHNLAQTLFVLAVVKYFLLIARSYCVARAVGLDIGLGAIASVYPVVQLAFVAGLTPAGLGIVEWSWVGSLGQVGVAIDTAGSFAVLHRLLLLASVGLVALGLLLQQGLRHLVWGDEKSGHH